MLMKDLPVKERPRERLLRYGEKHLSAAELMAILLRTGTRGESAHLIAQKMLVHFGGIAGIRSAGLRELSCLKGVGRNKSLLIKAAFELGRRAAAEPAVERLKCDSQKTVFQLYRDEMKAKDREILIALHLDTKKQLIAEETISVGTLNSSLVHPREVFRKAIKNGADSIILLHNHPSGDPVPSPEDIEVTRKLKEVGQLVGIPVLDHLVFGECAFQAVRG